MSERSEDGKDQYRPGLPSGADVAFAHPQRLLIRQIPPQDVHGGDNVDVDQISGKYKVPVVLKYTGQRMPHFPLFGI